jgi:uncharacterized protein (TIGR03435 family)
MPSFCRKAGLGRAVLIALSLATAGGQVCNSQQPSMLAQSQADERLEFEVASIKPSQPGNQIHGWRIESNRILIQNFTLSQIIMVTYGLKSATQLSGGPKWIDSQHFDIEAKVNETEAAKMQNLSEGQNDRETMLMMRSLLADRFQLTMKRAARLVPIYALVLDKAGSKLTPSPTLPSGTPNARTAHSIHNDGNTEDLTAVATSMPGLADLLTGMPECGGRVVLDRTGLSGSYDFKLDWATDTGNGTTTNTPYPSLFTALREQLGLRLDPQKASEEVLVIDHVAEPSPN